MKAHAAIAAFLVSMICACSAPSVKPPAKDTNLATAEPLALMEKVADWQLAHMNDTEIYPQSSRSGEPRGWVQGAFFVGLTALADRSAQPRFAQALLDHGAAQQWRLGDRLLHADDHVIGQSYLWAYERRRDPAMIAPTRASFDAILANPPQVSLDFEVLSPTGKGDRPCQVRWCWSDALFMSPPTWAELSAALGDPRYLQYGDDEFWATTDYLYDHDEHLYYRDSRFHRQRASSQPARTRSKRTGMWMASRSRATASRSTIGSAITGRSPTSRSQRCRKRTG